MPCNRAASADSSTPAALANVVKARSSGPAGTAYWRFACVASAVCAWAAGAVTATAPTAAPARNKAWMAAARGNGRSLCAGAVRRGGMVQILGKWREKNRFFPYSERKAKTLKVFSLILHIFFRRRGAVPR
ncbi:hypothetical protein D3C72_1857310 [compost metagenome]